MKTLKLTLAALFLASTLTALAGETERSPRDHSRVTKVSFEQAMQNPTIVSAMIAQLSSTVLESEQPMYALRVVIRGKVVYIVGTYAQWKGFFTGLGTLKTKNITWRAERNLH
jgi:hypothetical protein